MSAWLMVACCWIVSFVFSGIEAGMLAADPVRLRYHVKRDNRAALRLDRLLRRPERLLVTILLVTNMADILALLLATRQFVRSLGTPGYLVAIALALPVHLLLLNVLPKAMFRRFPLRALGRLAGVLELVTKLLTPLLEIGQRLATLVFWRRAAAPPRIFAAREELKQITAQSEREGTLTAAERAMIHNVVDFRAVKVCDVMLPLAKVVSIDPDATVEEVLRRTRETGVERLPVITRDRNAVGLVNVLDVLLDTSAAKPLRNYIRRIVPAREDEPAYRVIQRLRAARLNLAAVLNAKHELTGIVTGQAMIRRLVQSA